jgi:hypothetical protein
MMAQLDRARRVSAKKRCGVAHFCKITVDVEGGMKCRAKCRPKERALETCRSRWEVMEAGTRCHQGK